MFFLNSSLGKPPSSCNEILYWKISQDPSRLFIMNFLPIFLAIVFGIGFFIFIQVFGRPPRLTLSNKEILIFLFGIPIILAFHEFVHGTVMQSLGARPKYGFWKKGLMFYAKAPGYAFKRNQYILIVLAPLLSLIVLICLGLVLLESNSFVWVLAIWAIVNASSSNADTRITVLVLRYPRSAYVVDELDGMRIFLPQSDTMAKREARPDNAQHRVHWTPAILRYTSHRAVIWFRVFSAPKQSPLLPQRQ